MTVDFHTHIFPDKLAERALTSLAETGGNMTVHFNGTAGGLIAYMDSCGVDVSVILNIATNARQMRHVNDFALQQLSYGERFVPFGSVAPFAEEAADELHRLHAAGVKGIKFHPEYQDFYVDDDRLADLYGLIGSLGFITVFHAGMDLSFPEPVKASPERLARVLPAFGGTPVVLAHMGGYIMWDEVEKHLVGRDVYFDTSYCHSRIPLPVMRRIIDSHGVDKVLFGSDTPWTSPACELSLIDALGLPDEDCEAIKGGNARRLLGI